VHNKHTVKELIMMKRLGRLHEQVFEQLHENIVHFGCKWIRSQEKKILGHKIRAVKPEIDFSEPSLYLPINPSFHNNFLPSPENGHVTPEYIQTPALQRDAPNVNGKLTFFHWQINQEANRMAGTDPEVLNMQDEDGDTILHIAVAQGKRALAYVLAAKMAINGSLDIKEHNNQTALQVAAATNQHLIVQDLLAHGAQINTRDSWGRSPLHVCAEKGHLLSLQVITISISVINVTCPCLGLTPLQAAVLSHNNIVKEVRCLENPCSFIMTELIHRKQLYMECIRTLMLMGARCGTKDLKSGRTSLHMASEEANIELLHFFLDQPLALALVNVETFNGNTALHIVSSLQNHEAQVDAVKLLLRRGANPSAKNIENEQPAHLVPEGPTGEKYILKVKSISMRFGTQGQSFSKLRK
uniref:Uncharacterized protein n=1 Tax=Myripristis murdjan TaxID=586833 RepID=A0A667Y018_9TELE